MILRFTKAETWIDNQPIFGNTELLASLNSNSQKPPDLADDVFIDRRLLHRSRLTLHVHETDRTVTASHHSQSIWMRHTGNVVDHRCASLKRRMHYSRLVGINRHRNPPGRNLTENRYQALQLFMLGRRDSPRARRFGTDIENIRPRFELLASMPDGTIDVTDQAISGK